MTDAAPLAWQRATPQVGGPLRGTVAWIQCNHRGDRVATVYAVRRAGQPLFVVTRKHGNNVHETFRALDDALTWAAGDNPL